jgi:hypothetical protein
MFCSQCGTRNDDTSLHCSQCGAKLAQAVASAAPPVPPPTAAYTPPPAAPPYIPPAATFTPPPAPPPYVPPVPPAPGQAGPPQVPNYMVQAILVTLFCCLPLGIVSIIKANEVNRRLLANDYAGALQASNSNRTILWIGFAGGLVICVIYFFAIIAKNS